jgi:glycerol-3-phosphate dehydrogenase
VQPGAVGQERRRQAIADLGERRFDLLVIGGGIVGAAIAAQAARGGLAVALMERSDFGSGTTAASSKLIHGGLRYLRLGDVRLVHEAHRERRLLTERVAPHLVQRLPFLLPLYRGGPHRPLAVHAGLAAYAALARGQLHRPVRPARAGRLVPALRTDGLISCGLYADAVTHDSRLCLATVRTAFAAGATVLNYASVDALRITRGRATGAEVAVDGEIVAVAARSVINAAGPWVDEVRRLEDPHAAPSVRLSKGAHVVLALDQAWPAALVIPHDGVRVSFAVPWEGLLLLGTTDTEHDGPPGPVEATPAEVEQVLAEARVALDPGLVREGAVRSTFAGLRVLPRGEGETANARREAVLSVGPAGMLSIAGGKLTTHRSLAALALRELGRTAGVAARPQPVAPLTGAVEPLAAVRDLAALRPGVDRATVAHLVHLYGAFAPDVLALADERPGLLEPVDRAGPDLAAQVVYAATHEWAHRADDILRRRTTIAVRGLDTGAVRALVEELADLLGAGPEGDAPRAGASRPPAQPPA